MRHLTLSTLTCVAFCWIVPSLAARGDISDAVQKLLPSTVAVELKASDKAAVNGRSSTTTEQANAKLYAQVNASHPSQTEAAIRAQMVDAVSYASGTIVASDGLIVTMVGDVGDGKLTVTLSDGLQVPAKLLVDDRRSGLQLIKIDIEDLSPVKIAGDEPRLGEQIATAMCRDINEHTVATGIVTAIDRTIDGIATPLIQTDVHIGPMSAGAPLANLKGELIGVWMGRQDNRDTTGISFAVPAKHVRQLVDARGDKHHVVLKRGYLGIRLNDKSNSRDHPEVDGVIENSAAQAGGLRKGDKILEIDGRVMKSPSDVVRSIGQLTAGNQVELTIERDGERKVLSLSLRAFPERTAHDQYVGAIQAWETSRVYGLNADGALTVWDLGTGQAVPFDKSKSDSGLTAEQTEQLIKAYRQAHEAQKRVGAFLGQTTVRVERSDVEKQLGELTERVVSLQSEVEKLTRELKDLSEKLNE